MIEWWHLLWIIPAAALFGFALGAWLATGEEPAPQGNEPQGTNHFPNGEDYCAECPFNPHEGDDENG